MVISFLPGVHGLLLLVLLISFEARKTSTHHNSYLILSKWITQNYWLARIDSQNFIKFHSTLIRQVKRIEGVSYKRVKYNRTLKQMKIALKNLMKLALENK